MWSARLMLVLQVPGQRQFLSDPIKAATQNVACWAPYCASNLWASSVKLCAPARISGDMFWHLLREQDSDLQMRVSTYCCELRPMMISPRLHVHIWKQDRSIA